MLKLTNEQTIAINTRKNNIIVSASAGTGKTHTMINRVVDIVLGRQLENFTYVYDAESRVSVDKILMMTFTKAAAGEMKSRLNDAFIKELYNDSNDEDLKKFIIEQIDLLPLCEISTIHSFASRLLREYFNEVELNPLFEVTDEKELNSFVSQAFDKTFALLKNDDDLIKLKMLFNTKVNDEKLKEFILSVYQFAYAQENMDNWLDNVALSQYDFDGSKIYYSYIDLIKNRLNNLLVHLQNLSIAISGIKNTPAVKNLLEWVNSRLETFNYLKEETLEYYHNYIKTYFNLDDYKKYAGKARSQGITSYKNKVKDELEQINSILDFDFNKNKEHLQNSKDILIKIIKVVKIFAKQLEIIKTKNNKLYYDDLEVYTVKLLQNKDILKEIQNKFEYVLVDEYQDINYLQEYIISNIADGNLFMVGDSKQSIYRFRQAVPEIFLSKVDLYQDGVKGISTNFNDNFRSRKAILDFVNICFNNLMSKKFGGVDYKKDAQLKCKDDDNKYKLNNLPPVKILTYQMKAGPKFESNKLYSLKEDTIVEDEVSAAKKEATIILNTIREYIGKEFFDAKNNCSKKISYSDFAILFKSRNTKSQQILAELIKNNIPIASSSFNKDFNSVEVVLLINLLRVINNETIEIPLYSILTSHFCGLTNQDLIYLKMENKSLSKLYKLKTEKTHIKNKLDNFMEFIKKYKLKSKYKNVFELLNEIIIETRFDNYLLTQKNGYEMLFNVKAFINSLNEKSYAESIDSFLHYYDNFIEGIEKVEPQDNNHDSVVVTTMHSSKGLEYPIVIFADTDSKLASHNFTKDFNFDRELGIGLLCFDYETRKKINNSIYNFISLHNKRKEREDKLNLLYVALTRAKNHLVIVGKQNKSLTEINNSEFDGKTYLDWLLTAKGYCYYECVDDVCDNDDVVIDKNPKQFIVTEKDDYIVSEYDKYFNFEYPYENSINLGIKTSVSAINKIASTEDLHIESFFENKKAQNGTLYHKILENIDFKAKTNDLILEELDRLKVDKIINQEEFDELDKDLLVKTLNSEIMSLANDCDCLREKSFIVKFKANEIYDDNESDEEIIVQGTIDLLIKGKENILVDYKLSDIQSENEIKKRYTNQLNIYQKAIEKIEGVKIHKKYILMIKTGKQILI